MSAVLKEKDFATESGHFYDPVTGEPRYTYINKKGGVSNTTVREARKFGWVPSVTQVLKQAAAPGLVKWMKEQAAKAAYSERPREGESDRSRRAKPVGALRDAGHRGIYARSRIRLKEVTGGQARAFAASATPMCIKKHLSCVCQTAPLLCMSTR